MFSGYKYIKSLAKSAVEVIQKLHICESVFCQLLDFPILHILFLHTLLLCHMLEFFNTTRVSNSLHPDQARHFVGPDLGPNCLQRLLADNKSHPKGAELNTKQLVDTLAKTLAKVNFIWLQFFHLAKVLATTNFEPG